MSVGSVMETFMALGVWGLIAAAAAGVGSSTSINRYTYSCIYTPAIGSLISATMKRSGHP